MRLTRFKVTNFRSVTDSGWVDVDDVTALIGVNESGKSNLLLALWKLKPANEGDIQPTSDYPKAQFGDIRDKPGKYAFISAEFDAEQDSTSLEQKADISPDVDFRVVVTRHFDGKYKVDFVRHPQKYTVARTILGNLLKDYASKIKSGKELKKEAGLRDSLHRHICHIAETLPTDEEIRSEQLTPIRDAVGKLIPKDPAKSSDIVPLAYQLVEELTEHIEQVVAVPPGRKEDIDSDVVNSIPAFVYYTHYGNLDSEIYLPHVVMNLLRDDLGTKELAKARTLRVLFSFVRLQPQEILDLGEEPATTLQTSKLRLLGSRRRNGRSFFSQRAQS